jgi:hypothetical protein
MTEEDRYDAQILGRIKTLEKKVESLNTWRAFVLGCVAPIAFIIGAFAHEIALFVKGHS